MPGDRLFVARERPHTYGAFRVQPELGAAPSDSAYLALDPSTNATVVVQTLDVRGNRQRKDAVILNALRTLSAAGAPHRSIALPIASGLEGRVPYVVYPYPAGITIAALVHDRGRRPLGEVVACLLPVASAIDVAASAGMHHGALTPSDIFVTHDGAVTVTRFGLVDALKHVDLDVPVDAAFASQDRAGGAAPALTDDVYSLAAIALYMIAGHARDTSTPREEERFRDDDVVQEWTLAPSRAEDEAIETAVGANSRLLQSAISRALSEDPSARQTRAIELVNELRQAIVEERPRRGPVDDSMQGFASEGPDTHGRPKVAHMIRPTAPPIVPRPPAGPPPSAGPMTQATAPLPAAAPLPPRLAREPMRRPATFMSNAVPVVHTGRFKRNLALVLVVVAIVGAAFASGLLIRTPDDLIPSFPRRTSTPIDQTSPAPREPLTNVVPTDPGAAVQSESPVAESPSSGVPNEADTQPPAVPPLEPTTSAETSVGQGDSIATPAERRTARPAPAPPPAAAVNPNTPGSLFATSRPTHAQLYVDDLLVGTMPLLMSGVSPGTHQVRVELPGWNSWSSSVQIEPGKRFTLDVRLDR